MSHRLELTCVSILYCNLRDRAGKSK
eukprot:UN10609